MSESPRYFQYAITESQMSSPISRYGGYYDDDDDVCDNCKTNIPQHSCDKCGNGICDDEECSMKFPHYSNTTFCVCRSCVDKISMKLVLLIDLGKLKLLKEKIRGLISGIKLPWTGHANSSLYASILLSSPRGSIAVAPPPTLRAASTASVNL